MHAKFAKGAEDGIRGRRCGNFSHSRVCEPKRSEDGSLDATKLTQPTDRETALTQMGEDLSERLAADRPYAEYFVLSDLRTKRWLANQLSP